MSFADGIPRTAIVSAVVAVLALFATIQLASDAMYATAAPGTLPSHVPPRLGIAVYRWLDRVAPAAYVEDTLANDELRNGNLDAAQRYAVRIPPGPRRDQTLANVAAARGERMLAMEYSFAAGDADAMHAGVMELARADAPGALELETRFRDRLIAQQLHPDAVADAYYVTGNLSNWLRRTSDATADFNAALQIAPLNAAYILAAANQAYVTHDYARARSLFTYGLSVTPSNCDMLGGLGMTALRTGDLAQARADQARASATGAQCAMLAALNRALR